MTMALSANDFPQFFREANGHDPFPWQIRLTGQLFAQGDGKFPSQLDLPTGSGKTSIIDIALFALAAGLPIPRRIITVVDRRSIVQQAHAHGVELRRRLLDAPQGSVLEQVKRGLLERQAELAGAQSTPLMVAELRGGIIEDGTWAQRPDVPCLITSTVDKIGSRLLFRGYGVSDSMKPIHAGLVGNDALILLDEVHLAQPFATLLSTIGKKFRSGLDPSVDRWQVVKLSATPVPAAEVEDSFGLDSADRDNVTLRTRLTAKKPVRLDALKLPADPVKADTLKSREIASAAENLIKSDDVTSVGVIVNRVRLAASIYSTLRASVDDSVEVILVTGRMRGLDRDMVMDEVNKLCGSGWRSDGKAQQAKSIVVATQTLEAGADLDFDVLLTEVASIDALVQRFGRVDRLGARYAQLGETAVPSVIFGPANSDDPVYGPALAETWKWLNDKGISDFGIEAMGQQLTSEWRSKLSVEPPRSLTLLRTHMDRLVRTAPIPDCDVDIAPFLHGADTDADTDVEIVWRTDVNELVLSAIASTGNDDAARTGTKTTDVTKPDIVTALTAVTPRMGEALSIPRAQAISWLRRSMDSDQALEHALTDIEGVNAPDSNRRGWIRPVLLWRREDSVITTNPNDIRPGDTVVVPTSYGGLSAYNWDPDNTDAVVDLGDLTALQSGQITLRLNPDLVPGNEPSANDAMSPEQHFAIAKTRLGADEESRHDSDWIPNPKYVAEVGAEPKDVIAEWIKADWPAAIVDRYREERQAWHDAVQALASSFSRKDCREVTTRWGDTYVVTHRISDQRDAVNTQDEKSDFTGDPIASANVGLPYPLAKHLDDVQRTADSFADTLGLTGIERDSMSLAGRFHDIGKADNRFQLMLHEGRLDATLLAKSGIPFNDRQRAKSARDLAGIPQGLRHELASLAMLMAKEPSEFPVQEMTLICALVATHHGFARPFFGPQAATPHDAVAYSDEQFGSFAAENPYAQGSVGGSAPQLFADAVANYGYYGFAWLEAILRLADHVASRMIEHNESGGTS